MAGFNLVKLIDPIQMTIAGTFTPRGAYDNGTNYAVGDMVDYNGSSYIMYNDGPAGTLPTDTSYWGLVAAKGNTGATGATGPQGDPGEGVPAGGTAGQILTKDSGTDYDTSWQDPSGAVDSVNGQTGVVVLDADDIDDTSTTHKFVTDADLTKLSNTSGINTGDQDLSGYALTSSLANVATSGDYDDLVNKPTIPSGTVTSVAVSGSDGLEVDSGSPITSSGTIALGVNASTLRSHINVENGADVTDATNVDAAGATMNTDTNLTGNGYFLDEDNMASNDATKVPSQQSVKAYVDTTSAAKVSDTAYGSGWNGDTTVAPSKNAVYDEMELRQPKATITTVSGTTKTLATADAWGYIRLTNGTSCDVTVPDNSDDPIPIGTQIFIRSAGAGEYEILEDTAVTVNPPVGGTLVLNGDVTLIKVATDEWDLVGATVAA